MEVVNAEVQRFGDRPSSLPENKDSTAPISVPPQPRKRKIPVDSEDGEDQRKAARHVTFFDNVTFSDAPPVDNNAPEDITAHKNEVPSVKEDVKKLTDQPPNNNKAVVTALKKANARFRRLEQDVGVGHLAWQALDKGIHRYKEDIAALKRRLDVMNIQVRRIISTQHETIIAQRDAIVAQENAMAAQENAMAALARIANNQVLPRDSA